MNSFPVSLVITSCSVSFLTGTFSFSNSTNLKSLPDASSLAGLLGLTVAVPIPVPDMFFCTP